MGHTMIEKILSSHSGQQVKPGDIVDVKIDARVARDFGGANVVKNLLDHGMNIEDPAKTCFTFDCNPGGSNPKYAENQQICRVFARQRGLTVHDINSGIGTHLAIDKGLIFPGGTLVSTDSHANMLGAIGAFGQGMGDQDIAYVWAHGSVWFKVPATIKVVFKGSPSPGTEAKDLALAALRVLGAAGLLEHAAEFTGDCIDALSVSGRITVSSMCTEMGGIIALFAPNKDVIDFCRQRCENREWQPVLPDPDAVYAKTVEIDVDKLLPLIARPGRPDDVITVESVRGRKIDSAFIGSCTNGRFEDMLSAARVLEGRRVAPGVVLKIVPSTDEVWRRCLDEGILAVFKKAGALVGNAGCAGCAAGQIGQNGPGEITVSTGNRNFPGKQGKGSVYLASPATVAASAVAGHITTTDSIPDRPSVFASSGSVSVPESARENFDERDRPTAFTGTAWVMDVDNIDTDMIYHNQHLGITDIAQMGQYTFGNLEGRKDFAARASRGDIVVCGSNFGCGSSRQQAVDCFKSLGIAALVAKSFGAIYERNAINAGFPILTVDWSALGLKDGDRITVDLKEGTITKLSDNSTARGKPAAEVQMRIYRRGGLLVG